MKKVMIIMLLLVTIIPAVSAEVILDETPVEYSDTSISELQPTNSQTSNYKYDITGIYFKNIELYDTVGYITVDIAGNKHPEGRYTASYSMAHHTGSAVIYVSHATNALGTVTHTRYVIFPQNWNNSGLINANVLTFSDFVFYSTTGRNQPGVSNGQPLVCVASDGSFVSTKADRATVSVAAASVWTNQILVNQNDGLYDITLTRNLDGVTYPSTLTIKNDEVIVYTHKGGDDRQVFYANNSITDIVINSGVQDYTYSLTSTPGGDIPIDQPTLRHGSVTMTDNNGTTISGFEVTAVNHYTGEEYTVSTDTDVAVMTLPMDRTIQIRDPWTGEYEDAPIGYYRFFGQSPGYKMLYEEGIQVSVMPEKYVSYQLCDIRVTQESGYLTGKHQFQIRSRSDNSILQSGTISAKSATTGEWYNTTVTDGIASLILPYDTSNSQSQYAGNYYVYASSPGYEDNDYGTQIVVMPRTVSEIRDILLTPIGGIPPAGNVTLRIQAFSETGTGIPNAEIFIAGVLGEGADVWDTYTASSTGYLTVSVPGNSTYDIVASGTGYYDSARRVEVFTVDPALIEIKLYLSGAPTVEPSTQPTGWVTPTSTQTSPPIQEDNLIGLSVKGLAKGFGIDYDTALLMFGLMIIFGAGGMVMSSVKGGAMEFIAGSIVGTFVAFALGLIPIWIFIIIAVVFGAYVLRVFVQGGQ